MILLRANQIFLRLARVPLPGGTVLFHLLFQIDYPHLTQDFDHFQVFKLCRSVIGFNQDEQAKGS